MLTSDQAIDGHRLGLPIQRAMLLDFIDDRTTHSLDQQYMLGPNILFAPVFGGDDHETEYYLPAGAWTAYTPLLGKGKPRVISGPAWIKEKVSISEIPAFVRPGSVLALGPSGTGKPDYNLAEDLEIRIYQLQDGAKATCNIPTGAGTEIAAVIVVGRTGNVITIKSTEGTLSSWTIRLYHDGLTTLGEIKGATMQQAGECQEHGGFVIKVESGSNEVTINV
jgi:alpha-glucosidase (family GH31 glycosyl hydrolase)